MLDAGPDYCKEAEDHLAKSVLTFGFVHQTFFVEKNYVVLLTPGWKFFCYRF